MLRPKAIAVRPLDGYRLQVSFDNGEVREFDVLPYIKGDWFGQLKNPDVFRTVRIAGLSVEWVGGQDLCPDELYYNSEPVQ